MKTARLVAVTLLFSGAAFGAEVWYEAYDAALKAIASQQWATAEAKLKTAIKDGPKPGRRVRTYGMQFIDYVPGYHLGVVYASQQRHREALEELRKVAASGLYRESDAEHKTLAQLIQSSEAATAPKTARVEPPAPAPAPVEPTPRPSEVAREAEPRPTVPNRASEPTPSASPRPSAETRVAVAKPEPARTPPDLRPDRQARKGGSSDTERLALRAFFGGDYATAIRLLDEVAGSSGPSAEALFYLGASYAAQGFLVERQRDELLAQARRRFAEARRLKPSFRADPRLVSPRILRLFEQAGS